jgi:hypothetical protein
LRREESNHPARAGVDKSVVLRRVLTRCSTRPPVSEKPLRNDPPVLVERFAMLAVLVPRPLLERAKAEAAQHGDRLADVVCDALTLHLEDGAARQADGVADG